MPNATSQKHILFSFRYADTVSYMSKIFIHFFFEIISHINHSDYFTITFSDSNKFMYFSSRQEKTE
ncbi:hypothetical protein DWY69_00985 [Eisenbergiella massiliensis]|uniref:Uncharacterized protein n=1 Tax=Eisenbergiella massiliensis TaxID=1720294 RepID=A0A3E3I7M6_9FIRM|nr:hypothetical protein DXC51_07395 [Eisenbergiella massiliensis]RGE74572.1 hypothetical protein DWY69_00985 [Eisenbergiella massiliensis]